MDEADLTLSQEFFDSPLACSLGAGPHTASLWISPGEEHVHLIFKFEHEEVKHKLRLLGDWDTWPPTADNTVTLTLLNGEWDVSAKGKNHQDACIGSGSGISWQATVVNPVPE